jgi:predicted nucleotidyltransferase
MTETLPLAPIDPTWAGIPPIIQVLVERIVNGLRPKAVVLFGSHARGEARAHSDVDLLVVWHDEAPPWPRGAAVREAIGRAGIPLDILVVTPSEFERLRRDPFHVIATAVREGKVLFAA